MSPLDLLGSWGLDRVIEDRLSDCTLTVHGTTTLSLESPGRIRWHESGVLALPAGPREVFRTLLVVERPDGWTVLFDDGRDFHPWAVGVDLDHPCSPDHYRGRISGSRDRWTVAWSVTGPCKDHDITSVLTRLDRRAGSAGTAGGPPSDRR